MLDLDKVENTAGLSGANFGSSGTIADIVSGLMPYIFAGIGIVLLLFLISGGFTLMFSAGDPQKVQKGKTVLTNALIGFVIVFVAYWIVQIVGLVFGFESWANIFG